MRDQCTNLSNPELKDLMTTMIDLATSNQKMLNQAARKVCESIPYLYLRKFSGRDTLPPFWFSDGNCDPVERGLDTLPFSLRAPAAKTSLNKFFNPYKVKREWDARCQGRDSTINRCNPRCKNEIVQNWVNSMRAVSDLEFMSNSQGANARNMAQDDRDHFVNVCSNLSMDSVMTNRSSGKIGTGVLGSEFRQLVENRQFLRPAASGDLALKDGEFLNWKDNDQGFELLENVNFGSIMDSHKTNRELLCELEDPATPEKSIMPVFSNNPFMVAYTIARSMTPEGNAPTPSFLEDSYPLGQMSKEECLVWPS